MDVDTNAVPSAPMPPRHAPRHRRTVRFVVAAVLAGSLLAAGLAAPSIDTASARQAPAAQRAVTSDGWELTTPDLQGMDAATLDGARTYAFTPDRHTQGVVVVRGGEIVSEWYAPGEGPRSWAASWSMAKSFTSALIGIAIHEGKIPSVDEPMSTYFPDWAGTPKGAITIRNVLHMESGLKWNESYDPADLGSSDVIQMVVASPDQLAYAASRPLEVAPGTRWAYSSGDTMLLSHVIAQATGMPADAYAKQKLFDPLGIQQVEWWRDAAGNTLTYCCLDMTSRDYARFGLLYLHDGNWNGQQLVPASWVQDSITPTANSGGRYGYQWWIMQVAGVQGPVFYANGHDGQFTYVIPSLDLVVVRNGDYVKSACPAVADPNLFSRYPSNGLVPDQGTTPPGSWSHQTFLSAIVGSVTGPAARPGVLPDPEPPLTTRFPDGQMVAPCATEPTPTTVPTTPTVPTTSPGGPGVGPTATAPPATPVRAVPTFTG